MITKYFKRYAGSLLLSSNGISPVLSGVPIKPTDGSTYYLSGYSNNNCFPYSVSNSFTTSLNSQGIVLGSGTTAATEDDYRIETPITSGLSVNVTRTYSLDTDGNPSEHFLLAVTNTSSASITVSELCYQQILYAYASPDGNSPAVKTFCFDRTLLDSPVTIAAGETAVIRYTLKALVLPVS